MYCAVGMVAAKLQRENVIQARRVDLFASSHYALPREHEMLLFSRIGSSGINCVIEFSDFKIGCRYATSRQKQAEIAQIHDETSRPA